MARPQRPSGLHPNNKHRNGYDFSELIKTVPELGPYVQTTPQGRLSIDFANASAVKLLNQALLRHDYGVHFWDIPPDYLCPPIPGRVDYLHYIAEIVRATRAPIRIVDIGTGANLIYPLLGHFGFGWQFVATDIDDGAINAARVLIERNKIGSHIQLRQQPDPTACFHNILLPAEQFTLTMCNPPFHASTAAANRGTSRKWRNLSRHQQSSSRGHRGLNFGGQHHELCCNGGEAAFIHRMIQESAAFASQVCWFTTLVSKSDNITSYQRALSKLPVTQHTVITMRQGQKTSHILAWSFV